MLDSEYYIQDNSDIENTKIDVAMSLYNKGDYEGALTLYLDLVSASYSYKLHYETGRCYYKLNDFENAEIYFKQSLSLENYKNPSYLYMGNMCHKKNDINGAIEFWMKSLSYKPDDEIVCLNLASTYFQKGMKFQAFIYYDKYFKYAKNTNSKEYTEIKNVIDQFKSASKNFYKKAKELVSENNTEMAIQSLQYAENNYSYDFDINYLLGNLYFQQSEYDNAIFYLKQAYCVDRHSLDLLQLLSTAYINSKNFAYAYCTLKRMLPLVSHNQKMYLEIMKSIRSVEHAGNESNIVNNELADKYYAENNYHFALFEYENCMILDKISPQLISKKINILRNFLNPESNVIKKCFAKAYIYTENKEFKQANKYFTKIMTLSDANSSDYKLAKSRLVNV